MNDKLERLSTRAHHDMLARFDTFTNCMMPMVKHPKAINASSDLALVCHYASAHWRDSWVMAHKTDKAAGYSSLNHLI